MQERCACLGETLVAACGMSVERLLDVALEVRAVRNAVVRHGDERIVTTAAVDGNRP